MARISIKFLGMLFEKKTNSGHVNPYSPYNSVHVVLSAGHRNRGVHKNRGIWLSVNAEINAAVN